MNLINSILLEYLRHKRVKSSNLKSIGYDKKTETLSIRFKSGGRYEYYGVSEDVYDELMGASSKGSYLYWNIRDEYDYERME